MLGSSSVAPCWGPAKSRCVVVSSPVTLCWPRVVLCSGPVRLLCVGVQPRVCCVGVRFGCFVLGSSPESQIKSHLYSTVASQSKSPLVLPSNKKCTSESCYGSFIVSLFVKLVFHY